MSSIFEQASTPIGEIVADAGIPSTALDLLRDVLGPVTEGFSFLDYVVNETDDGFDLSIDLLFPMGFTVAVPGLDGMAIVLLDDGSNPPRHCGTEYSGFPLRLIVTGDKFVVRFEDLSFALRFPDWMLSPA